MKRHRWPCFLLVSLLSGCNASHVPVPVSGAVTLDGQPVTGHIVFVPSDVKLPKRGGPIENGRYDVPAQRGPLPGPHRVEIYSRKKTGRTIPHPDPELVKVETVEIIPARYNKESGLTVDLKPRENAFDFDLTSK